MRLALRGLWWRRGSSSVVLLVIVLAVAGAVAGPLFSRAAAESALRIRLEQAPVADPGIRVSSAGVPTDDGLRHLAGLLPAALAPYFTKQIPAIELHTAVLAEHDVGGITNLAWRPGVCRHLVLVSGRCPHGRSEAVVSDRTVDPRFGVAAGAPLRVSTGPQLRVVGVYRPLDLGDAYWFGHDYFNAHLYQGSGDGPDTLDSIFVDEPALTSVASPDSKLWVDWYLSPGRVRLDDLAQVETATTAMLRRYPPTALPGTQTRLPQVLAAAAHDRQVLNEGCLVVTVQLVLLGWLVLHHIITGTSEARATEVAAAKLRGWRPAAVIRFGLAEPALLLAAGVPLGMLAGYAATNLLAATTLTAGTPVLVRASSFVAALLAAAGAAVAAAVASRQVLRRPILAQWRRADVHLRAGGRGGLIGDLVIAGAACAGLVALRLTGALSGSDPKVVALFAPALFIVAVAKLGTRLVPATGRLAVRRSRASRHVATFLAVRQVARRRDGLGASALLAVAVGLAVFSVAAISVIGSNQQARARGEVGAAQVVTVQPQPGTTLERAVDRADPAGRWAMAVVSWQPVGGNIVGQVYAVQTNRLAQVAAWKKAWGGRDLAQLARELRPPNAPSVAITGDQVRVDLTGAGALGTPLPNIALTLADRRGAPVVAIGPTLHSGHHTYTVSTPCSHPCRLVDLEVYRAAGDSERMSGTVVVHGLAQRTTNGWQPVAAHLTVTQDWRPGLPLTPGYVHTHAEPTGLRVDYSVEAGGWPRAEVADYPRPLPVAVAARAQTIPGQLYVGELTQVIPLNPIARPGILPRALASGVLADLDLAADQLPGFGAATDQVWLGPSAPRDALSRLRAAGLSTGEPDTLAAHLRALRSQGPAQTLNLLRFASLVASLLALAATVLSLALTARRRAFELAALAAAGVHRSMLRRGSVVEQFLLLAIGAGLGTVAALVAFAVGASSVPQFSDATPVPLTFAADPWTVVGFLAALVVLVVVGATVAGRLLLRTAVPSLLREAAP